MMFRLLLLLWLGLCIPGADSLGIQCYTGDSVMLPCDGAAATDTKEVNVLWMFNNKPAFWYKNGEWCENSHHLNRTQLVSIQQNNFSLIIKSVRIEDDGLYRCDINKDKKPAIRLIVEGSRKQRDAVKTADSDPVCRKYTEREDTSESGTKNKQDPDKNPPGASSGGNSVVTGVTVGIMVIAVVMVGAALFTRRLWNQQRAKKLPNPRSKAPLINDASVYVEGCSADKKMGEPAV